MMYIKNENPAETAGWRGDAKGGREKRKGLAAGQDNATSK